LIEIYKNIEQPNKYYTQVNLNGQRGFQLFTKGGSASRAAEIRF